MKQKLLLIVFFLASFSMINAQEDVETGYGKGYRLNFDDDGTKYLRIIAWGQFWGQYNENVPDETQKFSTSIRRARVLMWTKFSDKFSLVTHFGLNSLNGNNQSPLGSQGENADASQLFFNDFWGEWKIADNFYAGAGLHYWNGISRLNNQSTLNLLTLDNNRSSWATIGLSDQFARHIGIYSKGKIGKLQYRVAINQAGKNSLGTFDGTATAYKGVDILGTADAGKVYQGYFDYNFMDEESNALPYKVGTYMGAKKVFNIGAGFFSHPNGAVKADGTGDNVNIFAADVFYDAPVGANGSAITAYATYQSNDYGEDFVLGPYATGNMLYAHFGYLLPGEKTKTRFQPYVAASSRAVDAIDDNATQFKLGANLFFTGHHSKLSLDYTNSKVGDGDAAGVLTLQAMIFL
ncbi:hypothetical protein [uncultured Maribacter sp.]|uniref:hypothetical protein n=1 Tax=uncultured Maribacter sp. TaxID=431308 RepID=UPI00261ED224|nr:hypothetical protein [uncultured Maribacter sp.]